MSHRAISALILIACIVPGILLQLSIRTPGDAAFLIHGAEYFFNGLSMKDYYYDNNPPMSFIAYIPAALLNIYGAPPYLSAKIYTLLLIALCSVFLIIILRSDKNLSKDFIFNALSSFLILNTIFMTAEFSQKDHLIFIALIPFLALQFLITKRIRIPLALSIFIFIACIPLILIKPHFGLLPVSLILHRMWSHRSFSFLKYIDFWALSLITFLYVGLTTLLMPEYLSEILPTALRLYVSTTNDLGTLYKTLAFLFFAFCFTMLIFFQDRENTEKSWLLLISVMGVISIIPFGVQGKGFSVHLVPTIGLLFMSLSLYVAPQMTRISSSRGYQNALITLTLSAMAYIYIYAGFFANSMIASHQDYKESDIANAIKTYAGDGAYFIEDRTTCLTYGIAPYVDNQVASRFPSMWFLDSALDLPAEDSASVLNMFGNYLAEDIERFAPAMIAFMLNQDNESPLRVIYKNHETVNKALQGYTFNKRLSIEDVDPCYRGSKEINRTLTFDIYTKAD